MPVSLSGISNRVGSMFGIDMTNPARASQAALAAQARIFVPWRYQYGILRAYYETNSLYTRLSQALAQSQLWVPGMLPVRNPAFRIVEFYAANLWGGCIDDVFEIQTDNELIVEPIKTVWKWSNWEAAKQVFSRHLSMYGDAFIKVANDLPGRVYFQIIDPAYVTDMDSDSRGFLTYIRIDIPMVVRTDATLMDRIHTEVWDLGADRFRMWSRVAVPDAPIDQLGTPVVDQPISDFGVDFVPIVHAKFRDLGDIRGQSVLMPAIDKIDECNRQATRLAQMFYRYNRSIWAVSGSGVDTEGRPLPPFQLTNTAPTDASGSLPSGHASTGTVEFGEDSMISLPGNGRLDSLVPDLKYDAARDFLLDALNDIKEDFPEAGYLSITSGASTLSGIALRFLMAPAIARAVEARGNANAALVRANMMALTLGDIARLPAFANLGGTFENGGFAHQFEERPVLPTSELEEATFQKTRAEAVTAKVAAGWSQEEALAEAGLGEDLIERMAAQRALNESVLLEQ